MEKTTAYNHLREDFRAFMKTRIQLAEAFQLLSIGLRQRKNLEDQERVRKGTKRHEMSEPHVIRRRKKLIASLSLGSTSP